MAKTNSQVQENTNTLTIIKGLLFSYILTIPLFIIFAFILTYTSFPETLIIPCVIFTTVITVIMAASYVGRSARSRGWLNGSLMGLLYMVVLYFAGSLLLADFKIDRYVIIMFVIGLLSGAVGGITGINIKSGNKKSFH